MTRKYKTVRTATYMVGTAADLGCDPDGGKWVHICLVHQAITNFRTKRDALESVSTRAMKGCEPCVTEMDLEETQRQDEQNRDWQEYFAKNKGVWTF